MRGSTAARSLQDGLGDRPSAICGGLPQTTSDPAHHIQAAPTDRLGRPADSRYHLASACRATTAFASRMARPSSPVRSKASLATLAQSSFSALVAALCVCLSASFGVHGMDEVPREMAHPVGQKSRLTRRSRALGAGCKPEALNGYGSFWFHSRVAFQASPAGRDSGKFRPFLYAICAQHIGYKLLNFHRKKWSADAARESMVKQARGGEVWHLTRHAADALKRTIRRFTSVEHELLRRFQSRAVGDVAR